MTIVLDHEEAEAIAAEIHNMAIDKRKQARKAGNVVTFQLMTVEAKRLEEIGSGLRCGESIERQS